MPNKDLAKFSIKIDPNAIWTYRYKQNNKTMEKHYNLEQDAIHAAVNSIEAGASLPVCIKANDVVVYDQDQIMDLWAEKFLEGA